MPFNWPSFGKKKTKSNEIADLGAAASNAPTMGEAIRAHKAQADAIEAELQEDRDRARAIKEGRA